MQDQSNSVLVEIRVMFLQIGIINTQTAQFDAHVAIEARWLADNSILSILDNNTQQSLSEGQIIHLPNDFGEQKQNWHPKLFLLNPSISNYQEQLRYSLKKDEDSERILRIYVREHRIVKGSFNTIFHLHHYPSDVQTLGISIGSSLSDNKIKLVQHPTILSGINKEIFEAQQEWHLYEHVEVRSRNVTGYYSQTDEDGDLDKPGYEKERNVLTFSFHAARQTGYFFWNGYCIILLLTSAAFTTFSIRPDQTQQRLIVAHTLLLSQIAFRWTISANHIMPPVSYLTTMDKYSVLSMVVLVILGIWHAVIGSLLFIYYYDQTITPHSIWIWIDRYIFFVLLFFYTIMNFVFVICHYRGPYRHRQHIKRKDVEHRRQILGLDKIIVKV